MPIVYYFFGSFVAATVSLFALGKITSPFFKVKSRFISRLRSLSGSGQR